MKTVFKTLPIFLVVSILIAAPVLIYTTGNNHIIRGSNSGWISYSVWDPIPIPSYSLRFELLRDIVPGIGGTSTNVSVRIIVKDANEVTLSDKYYSLPNAVQWYFFEEPIDNETGGNHKFIIYVPSDFRDGLLARVYKEA